MRYSVEHDSRHGYRAVEEFAFGVEREPMMREAAEVLAAALNDLLYDNDGGEGGYYPVIDLCPLHMRIARYVDPRQMGDKCICFDERGRNEN